MGRETHGSERAWELAAHRNAQSVQGRSGRGGGSAAAGGTVRGDDAGFVRSGWEGNIGTFSFLMGDKSRLGPVHDAIPSLFDET